MRSKRAWIIVAALIVAAGVAWWLHNRSSRQAADVSVELGADLGGTSGGSGDFGDGGYNLSSLYLDELQGGSGAAGAGVPVATTPIIATGPGYAPSIAGSGLGASPPIIGTLYGGPPPGRAGYPVASGTPPYTGPVAAPSR